jgi:hypothetical protein
VGENGSIQIKIQEVLGPRSACLRGIFLHK